MSDPAEPSADPTRDRLVAAAAEVFAEQGYDRAGVQEIARRAGFTTGAIYGRFRGKGELLLAAIEAQSDDEFEQLFSEHRFEGKATDIITTVGSHLVTEEFDNGQALLLEAFVAARREPEVAVMLRRVIQERTDKLTALIDDGKRTGGIDPELDTLSIVRFCHAVGLGFLLFGAVDLGRPEAAPWETLIERLVRAVAQPGTPAGAPHDAAPEPDGTPAPATPATRGTPPDPAPEDAPAGRTRTTDR
jgi:AcrR family transcriptional regulator